MKSTRTTILVSLMVIMSAMLVTVHPVAPAHAATSTVSVAGVATVGPVPADPVPHDPACYNACWQQLQDDLDNASDTIDDLRDQADAADDEAAGYEACADAALEDYIDCRASAELPSTCDHYFDTFTDCANRRRPEGNSTPCVQSLIGSKTLSTIPTPTASRLAMETLSKN